jgi:formate hydrogenlyase subunit 3/multisubunit Na+/H+ antiporter MnhD subunit
LPLVLLVIGAGLALTGLKTQKGRDAILAIILISSLSINSYFLFQSISNHNQYVFGPITANASGLFMSELILFLGFLILIYSMTYLKDGLNNTIFYSIFLLFLFSMIGLSLSFNIMVMYTMLEISTITSAILILYEKTRDSLRAVGIYISISLIGTIFILVGIFSVYNALGTLTLTDFTKEFHFNYKIATALLFTAGFGIKAGLVPAGLIWLPKAHSEAPTPVSALLSGILVQVAAFALIRAVGIIAFGERLVFEILLVFGLLSALIGSLFALLEVVKVKVGPYRFRSDIKRILAFSTISEVGIIIFIVGLISGTKTDMALLLVPAIIHITNHALAKSNLFLSAGNFIQYTKTRDITLYNGLLRKFPVTAFSFVLGGLSISMIPPLFGFTTIREISMMMDSQVYPSILIMIALMALTCYLLCFVKVFGDRKNITKTFREEKMKTIIPILILDIILLTLGLGFSLGLIDGHQLGIEEIARTIIEI